MRVLILMTILSLWTARGTSSPHTVARVNEQPILESDVVKQLQRDEKNGSHFSRKEVIDRLVLFELAIQEAKRMGLPEKPELKQKIREYIYQSFLNYQIDHAKIELKPSAAELSALYKKWPLVQVRHLALITKTPEARVEAADKLRKIHADLAKGVPFQSLVLKYSQDPSAKLLGGNLDYLGKHNLEDRFYQAALKTKVGEVSEAIHLPESIHLLQVVRVKPYSEVEETYLGYLKDLFRTEKESLFFTQLFDNLKKKAKIEIHPKEGLL